MNRNARKRRHKRIQQEKYMKKYSGGSASNLKLFEQKKRDDAEEYADSLWGRKHPARNGGWEYWQQWYISGRRKFAKKCSNKRIRQKYRIMSEHMDHDDVPAPQRADYEKEYDYAWTIW